MTDGKQPESMTLDTEFWVDKRVLVTGHTGFKGGWLSMYLHRLGAHVSGVSLPPDTSPNLFECAKIESVLDSRIVDIRHRDALRDTVVEIQPDIVFHLAAQPLVRRSYRDPVETFDTNVMGSINLLEAVRQSDSVKAVIMVTSDKCYLNREWHWGYRENEPLGGHDPYSASKACTEIATHAWRASFMSAEAEEQHNCSIATARAGNVIGGGDWSDDRLIPDILRSLEAGDPITLRNPQSVRPWQHVLEPLRGYLQLGEKLFDEGDSWAEGWNFGPPDDDARNVAEIVDLLSAQWPSGGTWQQDVGQHPHEARYLKLDCSKARERLGWKPVWNLRESLKQIVRWQHAFLDKKDMFEFSINVIEEYEGARNA